MEEDREMQAFQLVRQIAPLLQAETSHQPVVQVTGPRPLLPLVDAVAQPPHLPVG